MRAIERAGYLAHGATPGYAMRLARARETIREGLARCQAPYVAFSAGKDSCAMLLLVLEQWPDAWARILTGGETRLLACNLDEVLDWYRASYPRLRLEEVCVDHVFADGWREVGFWEQYETFRGEWRRYLLPEGADGVFIGLRAEESNARRIALSKREPDTRLALWRYRADGLNQVAGVLRICPLDRWTVADVGALLAEHGAPLLAPYQHEGLEARTHGRLGRTSMRMGQLEELRRRDPAAYNRIVQRFPELGGGQVS